MHIYIYTDRLAYVGGGCLHPDAGETERERERERARDTHLFIYTHTHTYSFVHSYSIVK